MLVHTKKRLYYIYFFTAFFISNILTIVDMHYICNSISWPVNHIYKPLTLYSLTLTETIYQNIVHFQNYCEIFYINTFYTYNKWKDVQYTDYFALTTSNPQTNLISFTYARHRNFVMHKPSGL